MVVGGVILVFVDYICFGVVVGGDSDGLGCYFCGGLKVVWVFKVVIGGCVGVRVLNGR